MKIKLFFMLSIAIMQQAIAQCDIPPPPGYTNLFTVDLDNDGIAPFNIDNYIEEVDRPLMESIYNTSSSAYSTVIYNSQNVISNSPYTNIFNGEFIEVVYQYLGTGPQFQPQAPCFFPVVFSRAFKLNAVPFDGDMDGDGILNKQEDTNDNLNLMDDDDDNDGIINLLDPDNLQINTVEKFTIRMYPNPVTQGKIKVESIAQINTITVYNYSGKVLFEKQINLNEIELNVPFKGVYFIKIKISDTTVVKKCIVL